MKRNVLEKGKKAVRLLGYGGTPWQTVGQALARWQEACAIAANIGNPAIWTTAAHLEASTSQTPNRAAHPQPTTGLNRRLKSRSPAA